LASPADKWALEHGRVRGDTNYQPKPFAPIKVDRVIRDGEAIVLGDVTLTAHMTPGHTPGCTETDAFIDRQVLPSLVAHSSAAFETALAAAREAHRSE